MSCYEPESILYRTECPKRPPEKLTVTKTRYRDSTNTARIVFSTHLNTSINTSKIDTTIILPNKTPTIVPSTTTSVELKNNNTELWITVIPEVEELKQVKLQVTFLDKYDIRASKNHLVFLAESKVVITPVSYFKPQYQENLDKITKGFSFGAKIVFLATAIFSFSMALALIKLMQMIDFMLLLNCPLPSNLNSFLSIMSSYTLRDLPNALGSLTDDTCKIELDRFIEEEVGCQVLARFGSYFLFLMIVSVVLIISYVLSVLLEGSKIARLSSRVASRLGFAFWVDVFEGIQLDVFLSFFLGIEKAQTGSRISEINFLIAGVLTVGWGVFNFLGIFMLNRYYGFLKVSKVADEVDIRRTDLAPKNSWYEKFTFLIDEFNTGGVVQRSLRLLANLKDIALSFSLVILHDSPFTQIVLIVVILGIECIAVVSSFPYKVRKLNIHAVIRSSLYTVCSTLILFLKILSTAWTKKKLYYWMGFPVIFFICCLLCFNLGVGCYASVVNMIWGAKKALKFLKRKRKINNATIDDTKKSNIEALEDSKMPVIQGPHPLDQPDDQESGPQKHTKNKNFLKYKKKHKKHGKKREESKKKHPQNQEADLNVLGNRHPKSITGVQVNSSNKVNRKRKNGGQIMKQSRKGRNQTRWRSQMNRNID